MSDPTPHAEREHSECSPSSLKNRSVCPSYMPDNSGEAHPSTISGTKIHEALDNDDDWSGLDDFERDLAVWCADYRDSILGPHSAWDMMTEPKLETGHPECYGYVDLLAVDEPVAHIFDWKTGWNYQGDASENLQGKAYTLGAFRKYLEVASITVHFPYPRLDLVTTKTFLRSEDFTRLDSEIGVVVQGYRDGGYKPDIDNCHFCGAKATCPHAVTAALQVMQSNATDDYTKFGLETLDLQKIEDPEQMARLLRAVPIIEGVADQIKKFALNMRIEDGKELPGYELADRKGSLKATDPMPLIHKAREMGLTDPEIAECLNLKLPALAKAVGQKAPRMEKGKTEKKFREEAINTGLAEEGKPSTYLRKTREPQEKLTTTEK